MPNSSSQEPLDDRSYAVIDGDQLQAEDTLVDRGVDDVLDEGYSPPDHRPTSLDADFRANGETIEDRIRQEVPDPNSAYGAPEDESGLAREAERVGGDDPDGIAAEDDWLGDDEVGDQRAGRLVAPDAGLRQDDESAMVATDVGIDGAGASAEEAAMHVIQDPDEGLPEDS
ncbi:MAG: hypothetical protein IPI32_11970 [Austwickia sp.]|nr:hypothetical protein [Austwickia sp.]MBK8434951.1 hypothetical protein [Austwickia sp.]MBK9101490.1 hypothetical protein [Austwickia sp.]